MMNRNKIAICAIAKNENLYIRDWIEYHKELGIDKIFLYDNNDINGEQFEDVINDYIISKYVIIYNKRGIEKGKVYDKNNINLQNKCYIDTYNYLKTTDDFKWVFFIDIDEYINIKDGSLKEYLNSEKYKDFDTISFPWIIYNDNNQLRYKEGSLIIRFPNKSNKQFLNAATIKSCIRIGKDIDNNQQYMILHYLLLKDKHICYETGEPIKMKEINVILNNDVPEIVEKADLTGYNIDNCNITISHYKCKTLEEYLLRQYKRHWGTTKNSTNKSATITKLSRLFFKYNEKTEEKINIFSKLKNIIRHIKIIVHLYYKNDKQIINLLNQINNQSFKPTNILIHITKEQNKKNKVNWNKYKLNIKFYYDTNKPNYPDNTLIKENDLKYKITLNDNTKYDDQFLKTLIIKSLFE